MKEDIFTGSTAGTGPSPVIRKPGRPRAIPSELEPVLAELYQQGHGFRAIARTLKKDYHIDPNFTTVKRTLKRLGILPHPGSKAE